MKKRLPFWVYLVLFVLLVLAVWFVVKVSGHAFLRMYVEAGIGSCKKIPILCMTPTETVSNPVINKQIINSFIPYKFSTMSIMIPEEFSVTQETVKMAYYKRKKRPHTEGAVYLLHQPPDFFVGLYPRLRKQGIDNDYKFIKHIMLANLDKIDSVTDAFFVIMKGIFTPDLGDQANVKMVEFAIGGKKGFINYNIFNTAFDCNVISERGDFFKVYIKDKEATLNLSKVLAIVSTIRVLD